jgi:amidase
LHGIPVLVKDNIDTADRMATTAGSLALLGAKPPEDSFVVKQLRAAGAVVLGKTNLSEWANIRSGRSTSGCHERGTRRAETGRCHTRRYRTPVGHRSVG